MDLVRTTQLISAFVEEWNLDSTKELKVPPEFLQKPISNTKLIDAIEHKEIYKQLQMRS